jgi:hypothetical protein
MNNFKLLKSNIDTTFIFDEIQKAIEQSKIKASFGAQKSPENRLGSFDGRDLRCHPNSGWVGLIGSYPFDDPLTQLTYNRESRFLRTLPLSKDFPATLKYLGDIARENNSYLQRVMLVLLLPNSNVLPHTDVGAYYRHRNRYHLVLQSEKGSEFMSGDERQIFREGELWWFHNKKVHSVKNLSTSPRIHIIFDLLPKNHYSLKEKVKTWLLSQMFQKTYNALGKKDFTEALDKFPQIKKILLSS